jgi:hypothetical protein
MDLDNSAMTRDSSNAFSISDDDADIFDFGLPLDILTTPLTFPGTELRTIPEMHGYFTQQYEDLAGICHRLLRKIRDMLNLMELGFRTHVENAVTEVRENFRVQRDTRACVKELMKSEQCNGMAAAVIYYLEQQSHRVPSSSVLSFDFRN